MSVNLLIGRKEGMTQLFDERGDVVPVTVVRAGPCPVVQVKTPESDGYAAVQLAFGPRREVTTTRPILGHLKKAGVGPMRVLREAAPARGATLSPGQVLKVDEVFKPGEYVDVVGTSKGKGTQGTVKRHNFGRGPITHGSKNIREPGSVGMHAFPSRVLSGKRMPGRMGAVRSTVRNLLVIRVDPATDRIFLRGAVPGHQDGIVIVRKARQAPRAPRVVLSGKQAKKG